MLELDCIVNLSIINSMYPLVYYICYGFIMCTCTNATACDKSFIKKIQNQHENTTHGLIVSALLLKTASTKVITQSASPLINDRSINQSINQLIN